MWNRFSNPNLFSFFYKWVNQIKVRVWEWNNNFNPMFHAQPEPPVYEKQMVETDQKYPSNGGMVTNQAEYPLWVYRLSISIPVEWVTNLMLHKLPGRWLLTNQDQTGLQGFVIAWTMSKMVRNYFFQLFILLVRLLHNGFDLFNCCVFLDQQSSHAAFRSLRSGRSHKLPMKAQQVSIYIQM